ncbi:hypothetical protein B0H14DRAFT_2648925 [Mycena olivaceomarginata]|nr:hypothetical protein B0H14DRAFT_2648925 [Mycena olivaceomarginata]
MWAHLVLILIAGFPAPASWGGAQYFDASSRRVGRAGRGQGLETASTLDWLYLTLWWLEYVGEAARSRAWCREEEYFRASECGGGSGQDARMVIGAMTGLRGRGDEGGGTAREGGMGYSRVGWSKADGLLDGTSAVAGGRALAGAKGSGGDGRWKARAGAAGAAGERDAGRIRGVEVRETGSSGGLIINSKEVGAAVAPGVQRVAPP